MQQYDSDLPVVRRHGSKKHEIPYGAGWWNRRIWKRARADVGIFLAEIHIIHPIQLTEPMIETGGLSRASKARLREWVGLLPPSPKRRLHSPEALPRRIEAARRLLVVNGYTVTPPG